MLKFPTIPRPQLQKDKRTLFLLSVTKEKNAPAMMKERKKKKRAEI